MRDRNSVLSENQKNELQVENFIYHIIKSSEETPEYLDEVTLANQRQKDFFKNIIAETGLGTQYNFIEDTSDFKIHCQMILDNPASNFVQQSKELAASFFSYHTGGTMSDGVLIVARVSTPINTSRQSLIALIKLDYTPVMRQSRDNHNARVELEEILEALSEQKHSVQKKALIDINNNFDWDVLAVERRRTGAHLDTEDAITDYFKNFMGIRIKQNDSTLTKKIVSECHQWAKSYDRAFQNQTYTDIRQSVISLMDANDNGIVDYDDIKANVCRHNNDEELILMRQHFDNYMSEKGLAGISFSPKPNSIPGRSRKGTWKTDTGITIIWNGERRDSELKQESQNDGSIKITIIANNITESE